MPSAITAAGLQIRPTGSKTWTPAPLTATGDGTYTGVVTNRGKAGSGVDIQVRGADAAGSAVRQTVERAYTLAGS